MQQQMLFLTIELLQHNFMLFHTPLLNDCLLRSMATLKTPFQYLLSRSGLSLLTPTSHSH
jgi:hypothetical protein